MPDRRVYLLDPRKLNPETIAVTFAKTSRSPHSFNQIAAELTDEKSAEFHERWVIGYGHASVAEHAVLHIAVENISRIAAECLESNRLASYTEKSTRYQKWDEHQFFTPDELHDHPLNQVYKKTCQALFNNYLHAIPLIKEQISKDLPKCGKESEAARERRIRSDYIDVCRFFLPASALANIGVTMNARTLEHALRKMYSHPLQEVRSLGKEIADATIKVVPTLIKYIDAVPYLEKVRTSLAEQSDCLQKTLSDNQEWCRVIAYDADGEERVLAASLFRFCKSNYDQCLEYVRQLDQDEKVQLSRILLAGLSRHDIPLRELEYATITFELVLDQGAYYELKRHRMMSQTPQPLNTSLGYTIPALMVKSGLEKNFRESMQMVQQCYEQLFAYNPDIAAYIVPNAFNRRVMLHMNLRSAKHFITLRTASGAHFSIRRIALRVAEQIRQIYPILGEYFRPDTTETWQSVEKTFFSKTQ